MPIFLDTTRFSGVNIRCFFLKLSFEESEGARSSGGERLLDTQEVGGSIPPVPTTYVTKKEGPGEYMLGPSTFM